MSLRTDTSEPASPRAEFADWVAGSLEYLEEKRSWSMSRVARESGISRSQLYRWLNPNDAVPMPDKLRQFCDRTGLDFRQPARILRWGDEDQRTEAATTPDLEAKIKRAQSMARSPHLNEEERAQYATLLRGYERAYERMLDDLIEQYEDEQQRRA